MLFRSIITFLPAARSAQSAEAGGKDLASYEYNLIPLLDRVIDLELPFSVVLGRATLPIKEVVKLTSGSLIELDQYVDQPMELRVRGAVVARCEVVTIGGNYGVRIKEIMSPEERMKLRSLPGNSKTPNR